LSEKSSVTTEEYVLRSDHSISNEVKKLGLTAHVNTDVNKFEPYWVETQPKYRGRRQSAGIVETTAFADVPSFTRRSSLESSPTSKKHNNFEYYSELYYHETLLGRRYSAGFIDPTGMVDLEDMPNPNRRASLESAATLRSSNTADSKYNFELKNVKGIKKNRLNNNVNSLEKSNPDVDRIALVNKNKPDFRRSTDDLFKDFPRISCGIFKGSPGLKRSNSAECLRKIKGGVKIFKDGSDHQVSFHVLPQKTKGKTEGYEVERNISKTSSNPVKQFEHTIIENKENGKQTTRSGLERKTTTNSSRTNRIKYIHTFDNTPHESSDSEGSEYDSSVRERINSLGRESVQWVAKSKVHQTKRERNMFSPTSF
jgi:hypothetical protein